MCSKLHFAATITEIYEQRTLKEYERRLADHQPPFTEEMNIRNIETLVNIDPLYRRFQEWLDQTDQ